MDGAFGRSDPFTPRWTQLTRALNNKDLESARYWFDNSTWEEVASSVSFGLVPGGLIVMVHWSRSIGLASSDLRPLIASHLTQPTSPAHLTQPPHPHQV